MKESFESSGLLSANIGLVTKNVQGDSVSYGEFGSGVIFRKTEPLITESQLAALENRQALVMIKGRIKFITWLPDFTEMNIMPPDSRNTSKRTYSAAADSD